MLLLEGAGLSILEQFGETAHELLQIIESPFGAKFTEEDIVSEVGIRTLAGCV
jgi:hypothetical protein